MTISRHLSPKQQTAASEQRPSTANQQSDQPEAPPGNTAASTHHPTNREPLSLAEQLALLLQRLAALQGEAVPAHRFSMLELSRDGAELAHLPVAEQMREMWLARFRRGQVRTPVTAELTTRDFPLLWVAPANATTERGAAYLIRGRLSSGACTAEDCDGLTLELSANELGQGQWLHLRAKPDKLRAGISAPETAGDWFAFAVRKQRRVFFEGIFATFIISSLALFAALYTMQVYDRVVPTSGFATLWVLTIGVVLAIGLEFMMKQARAHIVERASKQIDIELAGVFFGKALDIRMDARPGTVGTFASQIRHFESVRNFMTSSTLFILADAPFALFFIGVIALIGGPVALVPTGMVPVAVFSGLIVSRRIKEYTRRQMDESNRKNGLLIEAIDGIESIKACGAGWKMNDRYRDLTVSLAENDILLKKVSIRATNLSQSIQQVNYVGMIAVGAYAITSGQLTMGGLIACSIIAGRALGPIAQIPQMVSQWCNAKIALEALDNIMKIPSDRVDDSRLVVPERCRGQLRIDQIDFGYIEDRPALQVGSLNIKVGERVAVVGAVGSGKSTLVKLLSGLYKPQSGTIFLDGIDMQQLAPDFLREHIGYLPQDVRLFNGTLRENLTLGLPTPSDSRILRAAQLTGLDKVIAAHPLGLELMIAEGGRGLSGGQRQLVGLTRLLIMRPRILLLDEPTASMDSQLEARVMRHLFREMPKESVLIIVTHKPAILPHVERIVVVNEGRIVLDDSRDRVLALLNKIPAAKSKPGLQQRVKEAQQGADAAGSSPVPRLRTGGA